MIKIKTCVALFLLLISILLGVMDFYASMYDLNRTLKTKLYNLRYKCFESFKRDLNKILLIKSYKRVRPKLQFLGNAEIVKNNGKLEEYGCTLDDYFLKVTTESEILSFSLNEVYEEISSKIEPEVAFDLYTTPHSRYYLAESILLLPGKLYLNYGIKSSVLKSYTNTFLINASSKAGLLFILLACLNSLIVHVYRSKWYMTLSKELYELREEYFTLSNDYKKIKAENSFMRLVFASENGNKKTDISLLCEILHTYFSSHDIRTNFQHHFTRPAEINIPEKDFYLICLSLLFYKAALSKDAIFKVKLAIRASDLVVSIKDNGFTLSESKVIGYTENIDKPSFVLEWWQILLKLEDHKVKFTQGNKGDINFIKLEIPLKGPTIENNIICLDDI